MASDPAPSKGYNAHYDSKLGTWNSTSPLGRGAGGMRVICVAVTRGGDFLFNIGDED